MDTSSKTGYRSRIVSPQEGRAAERARGEQIEDRTNAELGRRARASAQYRRYGPGTLIGARQGVAR